MTRDGDRFAASGWRVASGRAVVTRSTVEEAQARRAVTPPTRSRPCANAASVADAAAVEARQRAQPGDVARSAQAQAEFERLAGEERRLHCG